MTQNCGIHSINSVLGQMAGLCESDGKLRFIQSFIVHHQHEIILKSFA
jgi:hypothetical protein